MKAQRWRPHARTAGNRCMVCGRIAHCPDCGQLTLHKREGRFECENRCHESPRASA